MSYLSKSSELEDNSIIWPGFVDVIATLLLVFVFLLAVLMISENFLTQAISGKNTALDNLKATFPTTIA